MTRDMDLDLAGLLDRAKAGEHLSSEDLSAVARELRNPDSGYKKYTLIHILGRAQAFQYRSTIEPFLDGPDQSAARLALQILGEWWDLQREYRPRLMEFAAGVRWDPDDDIRQMALSVLGGWLRTEHDLEVLQLLMSTAEDPDEEASTRRVAVRALARAVGQDYRDMPPVSRRDMPESPWGRQTLDAAHKIEAQWQAEQ
jgi:hypothetical protein